ncbi:MAG: hypothetical protein WKF84_13090 [Pyrinomonadaceae bacterium]
MRSKEEAHDYRYFPEPDLPPLVISREEIERIKASMPELPDARRDRLVRDHDLSFADASQLTQDRELADYFEETAKAASNARSASNWIRSELLRELESVNRSVSESPVSPQALGELIRFIDAGKISGKQAKDVLVEMFASGKTASAVVEERGLVQVSDVGEIEQIIDTVLAASASQVTRFRAGKEGLFGFFVGQVMKASKGKANPKLA